jgi:hypothetical protein
MEHTLSKVNVYMTHNYTLFENIDGNRPLNKKKIQRIIQQINEGNDVLDEEPVLVKEEKGKLKVLDGQHRVEIAKMLKRPVHYILRKHDMSLHSVAKVNSNVEKWKDMDFIRCYVKAGVADYKTLEMFHQTYGIGIGVCLYMLTHGMLKVDGYGLEDIRKEFEMGAFRIKKHKEACQVAEICKQFEQFSAWNSRPFIVAICKIIDANIAEMDLLVKKFNKWPNRLQFQPTWKSYLNNLEEIYNIDNSKRRTIY